MKRRRLLAAIGAGAMLAGCLDDEEEEDEWPEYEECSHEIVSASTLPEPAQDEIETAIIEVAYETDDRLILDEVIDTSITYLRTQGEYFRPDVDTSGDTTRLQLSEETPEREEILPFENRLSEDVSGTVTIITDDGEEEEVVNTTVDVDADDTTTVAQEDFSFGDYVITVDLDVEAPDTELPEGEEVDDGMSTTDEFTLDEHSFFPTVEVTDEEVIISQDVVDPLHCEWNEEGNIILE